MYKWNLGIIVSFLQMSSWSDPTSSSLKSKFRSVRNMSDKFRISLISESSKIMESWLKDTYIIYAVTVEVTEFNNRKNLRRSPVFPARGQSWNKNSQREKVQKRKKKKKITGLNMSWKCKFYFYLLRLSEAYQRRLER